MLERNKFRQSEVITPQEEKKEVPLAKKVGRRIRTIVTGALITASLLSPQEVQEKALPISYAADEPISQNITNEMLTKGYFPIDPRDIIHQGEYDLEHKMYLPFISEQNPQITFQRIGEKRVRVTACWGAKEPKSWSTDLSVLPFENPTARYVGNPNPPHPYDDSFASAVLWIKGWDENDPYETRVWPEKGCFGADFKRIDGRPEICIRSFHSFESDDGEIVYPEIKKGCYLW